MLRKEKNFGEGSSRIKGKGNSDGEGGRGGSKSSARRNAKVGTPQ